MPESSDVTETIVNKVAEYEECPPAVLPAIEEKIDSETYRELALSETPPAKQVEFTYLWYQVIVHPTGEVTITL